MSRNLEQKKLPEEKPGSVKNDQWDGGSINPTKTGRLGRMGGRLFGKGKASSIQKTLQGLNPFAKHVENKSKPLTDEEFENIANNAGVYKTALKKLEELEREEDQVEYEKNLRAKEEKRK